MSAHRSSQMQGAAAVAQPLAFDSTFRARLRDLLLWRRDVRRFRRDPLPDDILESLIELACLAPSVGLSQPWRFVIVEEAAARSAIRDNFAGCNAQALAAQESDRAGLYARLKLASVRAFVARMIVICAGEPPESPLARVVEELINAWAIERGIVYKTAESEALKHETAVRPQLPSWVEFLLSFDVEYRRRRLHFLIEGQNRLYRLLDETHFPGLDPAVVDRLKRAFYSRLDRLRRCEEPSFFSGEVHSLAQHLFESMPAAAGIRNPEIYAREFAASAKIETVDRLVEALRKEIDLNASTRDLDELLASLDPGEWQPQARREILINYLGFPFWDVLTFPVIGRDASELQEILVDRISPEEAQTLKDFASAKSLKGIGFENFAGFFSRGYRENDYLLGRLHGLDRLIDIVCDAAGVGRHNDGIDILALKRRAPETIANIVSRLRPELRFEPGARFVSQDKRQAGLPVRYLFAEGRTPITLLIWAANIGGTACLGKR